MTTSSAGRHFDCASRWAPVRKILSFIPKFAYIRANGLPRQIQCFGYLRFRTSLAPKSHEQLVALCLGRTLAWQEFRWRQGTEMPIGDPGEDLLEADSESASDADHRENPEVPLSPLEVHEIATTHGCPVGQRLLGELCLEPGLPRVGSKPINRRVRLGRGVLHPEEVRRRIPDDAGRKEAASHVEAPREFENESELRNLRPPPLDPREVAEVRLRGFGELPKRQPRLGATKPDVDSDPAGYVLTGGFVNPRHRGVVLRLLVPDQGRRRACWTPLAGTGVDPSRGWAAIAEGLAALSQPMHRRRDRSG